MLNTKNTFSFEIDDLREGKSEKIYDISEYGLESITKEQLLDLLANGVYSFKKGFIDFNLEELKKEFNVQLLMFHKPENFDFFGIIDPRDKELNENERKRYSKDSFPKTVINTLPHATYHIPSDIRSNIKEEIQRLILIEKNAGLEDINSDKIKAEVFKRYSQFLIILKNFSDHGTHHLLKNSFIPKTQIITATTSRGLTDYARQPGEKIMENDFSGNAMPESFINGVDDGQERYAKFHEELIKLIEHTIEEQGGVILIDGHDTGIADIREKREEDLYRAGGFPFINLGTKDGKSCNLEIIEYYADRIKYHLGIEVVINNPYKGGYITTHYGKEGREKLQKGGGNPGVLNVIQEEVGKYLYLDEQTQKIDHDKIELIGEGLARAKTDLGIKFGEEYFSALGESENAKDAYLKAYDKTI